MSDKTLGKARGLNSIANPRDFKGSSGRARLTEPPEPVAPPPAPTPEPTPSVEPEPVKAESSGRRRATAEKVAERTADVAPERNLTTAPTPAPAPATPHRAVTPGIRRKRRELSVPHKLAEALELTGINPADIVMSGYRKHSDSIYAGAGGRMMARGRTRLRLSISDTEFEQLTRLGQARGWNRSETVSVILAMQLLTDE